MKRYFTLILLFVALGAQAQFTAPVMTNSPVCQGSTLSLTALGTNSDTYLWTGPGGFTSTLQNPVIPNVGFADAGVYTLVKNGVNVYNTPAVVVNPSVSLYGVTDSQAISLGASVQLNAQGAQFFIWTPGDKTLSNPFINDPLATPTTATTYKVVGMNDYGCRDSAFVYIDVIYNSHIYIPSAFTPNGDGLNDVFRVVNPNGFQLAEFRVFDKWGQVIYNNGNGNIQQGWDGTFNGTPQDIGTYSYIITVVTPDNEKKMYSGAVTLLR